jgi:hypothetical protein
MNKLILSLTAAAALFAGASAANATNYGYGHGYDSHYQPVSYYVTKCHFVPVKIVKWVYGEKVIVWKNKKVCKRVLVHGY